MRPRSDPVGAAGRSLRVPAGVDTDSRLRVREEGNSGRRGGPPGDLFVFITVKSDPGAVPPPPSLPHPFTFSLQNDPRMVLRLSCPAVNAAWAAGMVFIVL